MLSLLYKVFIILGCVGLVLAVVFGYPAAIKYLSSDPSPESKYIFARFDSCKIDYTRDPAQMALPWAEQNEFFCLPQFAKSNRVILTPTHRAGLQKLYAESEYVNENLYIFQTAKPLTMEQLNKLSAQFRASSTDKSSPGSHYLALWIEYDGKGRAVLLFFECEKGQKESKKDTPGWVFLGASGTFLVPAKMIEGDTCFGQCEPM